MLGALLVGAVAMTARSAPDADAGLPATAFVGMRVIDGTGAAPRDDMVVVVRGAHISALGHRSDIDVPNGASVIDATGQVLMPGLVDLHCHYGGGRDGLANAFGVQLRFGVTTVRSLGADGGDNLAAIAEAESGAFPRASHLHCRDRLHRARRPPSRPTRYASPHQRGPKRARWCAGTPNATWTW